MPTNAINDTGVKYVYDKLDAKKVDKETGKGLSTNDYTTTDKNKVATISNKADKVSSATNGNLAGLNGSGNPTDSGWNGAKDTTSISGNPISISGLKSNQLAVNPIITLEPIQDLHGQSKPYPAGGGKNKLLLSTQSGTYGDVVTTVNSDGTILCNGTASAEVNITLYNGTLPSGTYRINGNPSGASSTTYRMRYRVNSGSWNYISSETSDPDVTLASTDTLELRILIASGVQISNKLWKPMIRLATETDSSFAPYENICPISGYDKIEVLSCGKNLFDISKVYTGNSIFSINGNTLSKTSSSYNVDLFSGRGGQSQASDKKLYLKAGTYVLSFTSTATEKRFWVDGINSDTLVPNGTINKTLASGTSFTVPSAMWVCLKIMTSEAATWSDIQIEEATTPTAYSPYDKTTSISESLGQTVYGGTLDVRTGVLTVDRAIVDLGSLAWVYDTTNLQFYSEIIYGVKTSGWTYNVLCSKYSVGAGMEQTPHLRGINGTSNSGRVYIIDPNYNDGTAFKTSLNGVQLVYELATPITIQLTPHEISLLSNYAYVSTNGTNIALDYHNGELASLSDVSQLGETLNALPNFFLPDYANALSVHSGALEINSSYSEYTAPQNGYIIIAEMYGAVDTSSTPFSPPYFDIRIDQKRIFSTQAFIATNERASGTIMPIAKGSLFQYRVTNKKLNELIIWFAPIKYV